MDTKLKDLDPAPAILLALFVFASVPLAILSDVYVLRYLWAQSIEPTFHVPVPSGITMYLLTLFASLFRFRPSRDSGREPTVSDRLAFAISMLTAPWIAWLMAHAALWLAS